MAAEFPVDADDAADIKELCSTKCVSGYKSLQNPSPDETPCQNGMIGQCIIPSVTDRAVYGLFGGSIRWKEGVKTILENFITDGLIDRYGIFDSMFREFKSAANETGFIIAKVDEQGNDGYNFCDDIVCTYKRQLYTERRGGYPANESLFHITIHSENPKYIRGSRRSKFTCAKYSNNQSSHLMGAFHYKIDENYDHELFAINDKPYKKLNPTMNGTFTTPNIQQTFNFDRSAIANQYAIFHEYIYNRFVRYWNRCITNSQYTNAQKQSAKLAVSLALLSSGTHVQQQKQQAEKEAKAATNAAKAEALLDDELDHIKEDMINAMIARDFNSKALIGKTLHAQKQIIRPHAEQYIEQLLAASPAQPMGSASAAASAAASEPQRSNSPVLPVETEAELQEKIALAAAAKRLAELEEQEAAAAQAFAIREMKSIESQLQSAKKGKAELQRVLDSHKIKAESAKRSFTRAKDKASQASSSFNKLFSSRKTLRKLRSQSRSRSRSRSRSKSRSPTRKSANKKNTKKSANKKNTRKR
jgi:hypothetical protein